MTLDTEFVRSQFPAFETAALEGQAFFENAGGSYPCRQVVDRLMRFYTERKVQPYAPYRASTLGGAEMDEARDRLSALLGVESDELSFGPSTTQNVYVLAQAFGELLSEGDAIIVTDQDHEANTGAWRRMATRGITVREWRVDPETGHLDPADLDALLDGHVKLVAFPHCSNIVGEINPVARITERVHQAGAVVCVDGVSYAPHGFPDIGALGADIYLFSSYKTYGPHQGIMVVRRDLADRLPNQGHGFNAASREKRFTPAGPDHAQIAACAGMVDYVEALAARQGVPASDVAGLMQAREATLMTPLLDALRGRNGVRLLGPHTPADRAPTIAIAHHQPGHDLATSLAAHGIMAGGGDFYAGRVLSAMGVDPKHGVLRLSFTHYTDESEIERLIDALDAIL